MTNQKPGPLARAVTLSAVFALGSVTAISAPQIETRSAKIPLAGLDLSTAEGMRAARKRLHEAAYSLCSNFSHPSDFSSCVFDAESAARRELDLAKAVDALAKVAKN